MLSDVDIKNSIKDNEIEISPLIEEFIQPSSVDLRVGADFRVFENHKYSYIDPKAKQEDLTKLVTASIEEPFVLHPGEFVLGTTLEKVTLSNKLVARLEGKSLALSKSFNLFCSIIFCKILTYSSPVSAYLSKYCESSMLSNGFPESLN